MLDDEHQPDYRHMDAAAGSIAPGVRAGATVIFETTLPVGDTRNRYVPLLEAASGLVADHDLFVAFSPERLFTGAVFGIATYPKLVGGIGPASTGRAASFYASVLDAEVVAMSSAEAAELSKLADTTYRDLNIAFANELAAYAARIGVDVQEVIRAANSQPYSHIHQPGLGVGGHCIPVYPHFLLSRAPEMELVRLARRTNDSQVGIAVEALVNRLGDLRDVPVLVLGLTYREGVHELAYSRALPLIDLLASAGAHVSAWDPLLTVEEIERCEAAPWTWGTQSDARAIVIQTADPVFRELDPGWFTRLEVVLDGRNSLRDLEFPERVRVLESGFLLAAAPGQQLPAAGKGSSRPVKIVSVVGTRPQLIKAAALLPVLRARHRDVFVDTGQHWDERMAGAFFAELDLPAPDFSLGIGGGGHAAQTGRMLVALEPILVAERPDAVLVYGDTNSTLAGCDGGRQARDPRRPRRGGTAELRPADARGDQPRGRRPPRDVVLRSRHPRRSPTSRRKASRPESSRPATSCRISPLEWPPRSATPPPWGQPATRCPRREPRTWRAMLRPGGFLFATIHRAENREPSAIASWVAILGDAVLPDRPVILALHPGTRAAIEAAGIPLPPGIRVVEPLGYRTSLTLQLHAAAVITDSGGIQRESAWLGTPCLVLRPATEWLESVEGSTGRLVVVGLDRARASRELARLAPPERSEELARARADGLRLEPAEASRRIVDALGRTTSL